MLVMASFSRGQLPARHTKVVDENQRPLKTGSHGCRDLKNDVTSPKPCSQGGMGPRNFRRVVHVLCVVVIKDVKHVTIFL